MLFTYEGADLSSTIKNYIKEGSNYFVEYLDGSQNYFVANEEEEMKIKNIMLEQLKERQDNMNYNDLLHSKNFGLLLAVANTLVSSTFYNRDQHFLSFLAFLFTMLCLNNYKSTAKKLKQLKKAKLFLEIVNELDENNQTELLKLIEFENIYQTPLDVNTLDDYSYLDVKTLHKHIKQKNK